MRTPEGQEWRRALFDWVGARQASAGSRTGPRARSPPAGRRGRCFQNPTKPAGNTSGRVHAMAACSFNEPTLRQGVQGQVTAVRRLQTCLKGHAQLFAGFVTDPGAIDGDFGPNTRASVVSFQTFFGSGVADGVVGPITWSQLDIADYRFPYGGLDLQSGSTGNPVRHLQRKLFEAASDPGAVDGIFGPNTQAAVQNFQQRQGLPQNGVAGGQTRVLLSFVYG